MTLPILIQALLTTMAMKAHANPRIQPQRKEESRLLHNSQPQLLPLQTPYLNSLSQSAFMLIITGTTTAEETFLAEE